MPNNAGSRFSTPTTASPQNSPVINNKLAMSPIVGDPQDSPPATSSTNNRGRFQESPKHSADQGLNSEEDDVESNGDASSSSSKLGDNTANLLREDEEIKLKQVKIKQVSQQKQDIHRQSNMVSVQLDQVSSTQNPGTGDDAQARAAEDLTGEYKRKFEEMERGCKQKMQQMEEDYQLAVHYVK